MRVAVCVPWRGGDLHREASWAYVYRHLSRLGTDMGVADSGHEPFNRAASRNEAAASHRHADVLIFHDADMLLPLGEYQPLATLALDEHRLVVGFDVYRALNRLRTNQVLNGGANPFGLDGIELRDFSVGGIVALPRALFDQLGGYDERFEGWGGEDFAFAHAAAAQVGPLVRAPNVAVHLWHPHGTESQSVEQDAHNAELLAEWTEGVTR